MPFIVPLVRAWAAVAVVVTVASAAEVFDFGTANNKGEGLWAGPVDLRFCLEEVVDKAAGDERLGLVREPTGDRERLADAAASECGEARAAGLVLLRATNMLQTRTPSHETKQNELTSTKIIEKRAY